MKPFHPVRLLSRLTLCLGLSVGAIALTGCGEPEAAAVADQEATQRYLDENPDLKNTNSEEPNIEQEVAPRAAAEKV